MRNVYSITAIFEVEAGNARAAEDLVLSLGDMADMDGTACALAVVFASRQEDDE